MKLFDYTYYRIAKFFYKKDGLDAFRAVAVVSTIQCLFLIALSTFILRNIYSLNYLATFIELQKQVYCGVGISIGVYNYFFRYKGMYWRYSERWEVIEGADRYLYNGYLVIILIILPLVLMAWAGTATYGII
jgi:hypothetical protein